LTADRYFDSAATSPMDPRVFEAMRPWLTDHFGNPHSAHSWGAAAREAVETARLHAASLIGAEDPSEIVFTSGSTEAINWALHSADALAVSPFEHSAVWQAGQRRGCQVLGSSGWTLLSPHEPAGLVAVMAVNNETGAVLHAPSGGEPVFVDATQAVGKIPWTADGAKMACFSSHKIHGPAGVGALYSRWAEHPEPLLVGGGQESGWRSGTLNVAGIVGFGEACRLAAQHQPEDFANAQACRDEVLNEALGPGVMCLDHDHQSPFILSLAFEGLLGEALAVEMDLAGWAVSSGAACSSSSGEPSRGLSALGLDQSWARGAVRISMGRFSQPAQAGRLGQELRRAAARLKAMTRS
jgi:cysteine desulfurase